MADCANCGAHNAVIGMDNGDILCTQCADILVKPFRSKKWRFQKLSERKEMMASVRRGLRDMQDGKTRPIDELWDGIEEGGE